MKSYYPLIYILILCFYCNNVIAQQNHIPNGNFEYHTNCPQSISQVNNLIGWRQYTTATPDYFNSCNNKSNSVNVPDNTFGYQNPASGNGYVGGFTYIQNDPRIYKEYIAAEIIPLVQGESYEISLSVSLADKSKYGTDDLGAYFYDSGQATVSTSSVLSVTPQVYFSSTPIVDTQNWVRVKKTFIADSAYDNIVIGGFKHYNNLTLDSIQTPFNRCYYLIDSVVLKLSDRFKFTSYDTLLCSKDTITLGYSVSPQLNSNNTFTLQLSDKNGSFSNPVNIGSKNDDSSGSITGIIPNTVGNGASYRIRMVSSSPADTSDTTTIAIRIANPDSSNIVITSNSPLCEGSTLSFTASTNVNPTTYTWTGPNSFSSTSANPTIGGVTSALNGNYYATLNFYGCEVKDTLPVTVKPLPVKPIVTNNSPLCAGDTLKLSGSTTTSGVTYSWTGPNSYTSTQQNPIITNSNTTLSGTYTQIATLNGCSRSDTTVVTVKPMPATTTLTTNAPLCEGDTLKVNSTNSSSGTSYNWTGPNSYTANTQNIVRTISTPSMSGYYKLLLDLNGCTLLDSIQAIINIIPATPVVSASNPLCVGDTLKLTANSTTSGVTYSWTGPNSFTSPFQNPNRVNISFSDTGNYKVTATANNCSSAEASTRVNANPAPFVIILSNKDSICSGEPVTFTALPNNAGGTPTYQWFVNAQQVGTGSTYTSTTLQNNAIVNLNMTEYTKCTNPFTDPSNDIQMQVLPWLAPSVNITANPSGPVPPNQYITFTATTSDSGNNPGYQWKRNGSNVVGAQSMIWSANTLNDNDSISVQITSSYMCPQPQTTQSNGIVVKILTDVNEINIIKQLVLYPNPNKGSFTVSGYTRTNNELTVRILSATGQVISEDVIVPTANKVNETITLQNVASGNYILQINDGEQVENIRFDIL